MFTTEELQSIDRKYFMVIVADAYDVTLISNNTRHVWYIHNVELKDRNLCMVYHKHKISHPLSQPFPVWNTSEGDQGYQVS